MLANKQQSGSKFNMQEIIEAGIHKAVLYSILDLGTQTIKTAQYGEQQKRQVQLSFELPEVRYTFSEEKGEQPASVHTTLTLSMHEKSALRKILNERNGKPLTDKEAESFDLSSILGKTCYVSVIHSGVYVNIASVMPIKKADKELQAENNLRILDLDAFDEDVFNTLSDKTKEKIIATKERDKIITRSQEMNEAIGEEVF